MKRLLVSTLFICASILSFAQGSYEAFRFSQLDYMGTARSMGAGGVFGSVGGDFSALNTNPASIGLYKRGEFSVTPITLSFFKDNTLYNGESSYTQNPKYTMPECGFVIANTINNSAWKTWQFGFGYNRIMDYNNTFRLKGPSNISFIDPIIDIANGTHHNNLASDALIAWNTWMIDTLPGHADRYFSPFQDEALDQTAVIKQSGGVDELSITFGGNYDDKLYLGATIGIPILDYTEETTLTESPLEGDNIQGITSCKTTTRQTDKGAGVNARIGIIYQPINFLRLSAAIHTPTYYAKISDTYTRHMTSHWVGAPSESSDYSNMYKFALSTPFKFDVGASFIIKKRAFITAEYEFYDYALATLFANDYSFNDENQDIVDKFKTCHTVRVGAEVNLTPKFMLRAGYNYKTSPYRASNEDPAIASANGSAHYGSFGFGFHSKYVYFDLAYVLRYSKDNYTLFDYPIGMYNSTAQINNTTHRIVATIGCKF